MNSRIRIVNALLLICSIVSCNKDKDEPIEPKSPRLSKMTQWKEQNPWKDILTKEYIYDSQQRVIEIVTTTGDSAGGAITNTYSESFKCYYNGNETNPYKTVGFGTFYVSSLGLEAYHFYNGDGRLIRDSIPVPSDNATRIAKYNYDTDKIVVQVQKKYRYSTTTALDSFLLADHNIKEAYLSYPASSYFIVYKFTYDNKVNPFNNLNLSSVNEINIRSGFDIIMSPGYCKNNLTEFTPSYSNGAGGFTPAVESYKINYTYDKNDLPIECRFKDVNYSYIIKYEYID